MSLVLQGTVASAALLFIAVSAIMNALFLSSLGRTPVEVALLAAVSIASDMVKAVLPVLILRAIVKRAWAHLASASVMLTVVTALSLASGTGFAALTRSSAINVRDGQADTLAARQKELRAIEAAIEGVAQTRPAGVVEADIAALTVDRRWTLSKSCTDITGTSVRKFCAELSALHSELASATARDRLTAERSGTRARIDALWSAGAGAESDPQARVIAALLGVDTAMPRLALPVAIAVVLELGSVILVLLLVGPTVCGWREPEPLPMPAAKPKSVTVAVTAPPAQDVVGWQLRRNRTNLSGNRGGSDER